MHKQSCNLQNRIDRLKQAQNIAHLEIRENVDWPLTTQSEH
ncbi:MAG: hypothetical protein AAF304_07630 [Pseudomonadota bacterium]